MQLGDTTGVALAFLFPLTHKVARDAVCTRKLQLSRSGLYCNLFDGPNVLHFTFYSVQWSSWYFSCDNVTNWLLAINKLN